MNQELVGRGREENKFPSARWGCGQRRERPSEYWGQGPRLEPLLFTVLAVSVSQANLGSLICKARTVPSPPGAVRIPAIPLGTQSSTWHGRGMYNHQLPSSLHPTSVMSGRVPQLRKVLVPENTLQCSRHLGALQKRSFSQASR